MSIRTSLAFVLATSFFALPPAAEAGQPKGPMWITMSADNHTLTASHPGVLNELDPIGGRSPGKYAVYFPRQVSGCAATATTTEGWVGVVGLAVGYPNPDMITVYTMSPITQDLKDLPFHLIVMCPK